jgi:hypothetical protein
MKVPFSNGTEGYAWMANHCDRCLHDAFVNQGRGCPIIGKALLDHDAEIPEWLDTFPEGPFRLGEHPTCVEFKPRGWRNPEPRPKPHPPGQDPMFDPPTGPLVYVDVADEARPAEVSA